MLSLSIGQYSSAGEKPLNQDSYGFRLPEGDLLTFKGAAVALADGISSSSVSHIASHVCVKQFLEDYFCTSNTWTVPRAATQVITAINRWLLGQSRNSPYAGEPDKGYVCTFSALIFKHQRVHVFHLGDARVYRLRGRVLEQLTRDHRQMINGEKHYLSNAMGINESLQLDKDSRSLKEQDCFLLLTDGVYEFIDEASLCSVVTEYEHDPDEAAKRLVEMAFARGSNDNLTAQIVRVNTLPAAHTSAAVSEEEELPIPGVLQNGDFLDQFKIVRNIYHSARSHVYLAQNTADGSQVVLKVPSVEMAYELAHLEAFRMEEWIARRIHSQHVVSAPDQQAAKTALYTVTDFVPGQTLAQWLNDNPQPDLETVRMIIEQVARGLMALHRKDVLHRDIRPENIMIDINHHITLVDLGAASVAGINEFAGDNNDIPGTAIYAAPEYFLGQGGSEQSEQFSLAVLTYYLLSGRFPYGTQVAKCRSVTSQHKLKYESVLDPNRSIPFWLDHTLRKALHPNPLKRYDALSEFVYALRHPDAKFLSSERPPLLERNPVAFWQGVSGLLLCLILVLLLERFSLI